MFNKKLLAILIIIFALIILIGLIYFMFLAPAPEEESIIQQPEPVIEEKLQPPEVIMPKPKKKQIKEQETTANDLKRIAASFVERYGSYSNQSGYDNIRDLELFMSRSMQDWARDRIEQLRSRDASTDIYYGITTKSVVIEIKQFDEYSSRAQFVVKTQRKESIGASVNARTFQQDALVTMVKEGGVWKVDRVVWEE